MKETDRQKGEGEERDSEHIREEKDIDRGTQNMRTLNVGFIMAFIENLLFYLCNKLNPKQASTFNLNAGYDIVFSIKFQWANGLRFV